MDSVSIVLVGSFNPTIFQPMWFAANELIARADAENAEVSVIHPDITQFRARQMNFVVEHGRFFVTCETIHRNLVRDLVLSCFGQILVHTPIKMMGLNRELHFSCGSEAQRSKFGFEIAPLQPWGEWGKEIHDAYSTDKAHGGMMRVSMRQVPRLDKREGYLQTDIQPSGVLQRDGIHILVNDHFQFEPQEKHPALRAMETLEQIWEEDAEKAEKIISHIMQRATGKG
jgi:hypothetical protein